MDMDKGKRELLLVDGYNVMGATPRYEGLIDEHTDPKSFDTDPFIRAREALISDVATYAQGRFDAVVVFDGASNADPDRNATHEAGLTVVFSRTGESADSVIERLATQARQEGRMVSVATSDNTIRATIGAGPGDVTAISSKIFVRELERIDTEVAVEEQDRSHHKATIEDRISPDMRKKLWHILRS